MKDQYPDSQAHILIGLLFSVFKMQMKDWKCLSQTNKT